MNYLAEVAQVVLSARRKDRYVLIEVATSKPGDIEVKSALVKPSIGALTVVQREHVKNFDSIEAIAEEKGKLIEALPEDGIAVLNIDDPLVRKIGERSPCRCIWFGSSPEADIRLLDVRSVFPEPLTLTIEYRGQTYECATALYGKHLAVPVLAALGLGVAGGVLMGECIDALREVRMTPGRMQIVETEGGVAFLRDDHKAPYWSFQAPLDFLRDAQVSRKVAVIGTISDYSLSASKVYPKVAKQARASADLVVFVGPHALRALKAREGEDDRSIVGFTELEEANRFLQSELRAGDLVLLKGSNRADHLIRLMLARSRTVGCWERGCGWSRFCDACPRLEVTTTSPAVRLETSEREAEQSSDGMDVGAPLDMRSGEDSDALLVVGLGNQGEKYAGTPHNVGFDAVDYLARAANGEWAPDVEGLLCRTRLGEREIVLFKASTKINLCGNFVARVQERLGIAPNHVVVIHDDADLPLGDIRLKYSGSDGGHKGLRSIFNALKNEGFMSRIRIGVRMPDSLGSSAKSLVLERFSAEDQTILQRALEQTAAQLKLVADREGSETKKGALV
jgi:aminoacyl-tRNA hydrolase